MQPAFTFIEQIITSTIYLCVLCIAEEALQGIFLKKLMFTYLSLPLDMTGKVLVFTKSMTKLHSVFSEDQDFT